MEINNICDKLKSTFPELKFDYVKTNDKVDFNIYDVDLFLSQEFSVFLDEITQNLSDEEYMKLNFIPINN